MASEPGSFKEEKQSTKINRRIVKTVQAAGWLVLRPLLKFFVRYQFYGAGDINKLQSPLIIISNHFSNLDPTIIGTILPMRSRVYPMYFIAKDSLIAAPVLGGFLKLCGAFRTYKKEGFEKSLAESKNILANGNSVVFFPQGHRAKEFRIDQGRAGTAILALESGKPVLPMAICGVKEFSWKNVFLRRYKVKVMIGTPFFLADKLKLGHAELFDLRVATKILMQEIMDLIIAESRLAVKDNLFQKAW